MAGSWPLWEERTGTLDTSGTATVRIGPTRPGTRWRITTIAVRSDSAIKVPLAAVFRGTVGTNSLGGSYTGTQDADTSIDLELYAGDFLSVRWTAGDIGASVAVSVSGTITI